MQHSNLHSKCIEPARRVSCVSEYYFSKKLREIAEMNRKGMQVISLGIGGPDLPPHADVIDTLCRESRKADTHSYQPYTGIAELRQAFAGWYDRMYGVSLDPQREILPLIGSKEGILHISLAFLNRGDGVLVPNPGYPTYSSVSRLAEAEIFPYDLVEEQGWMPDFEALERLPLERIKLMWVNYPNMPTGASASPELFARLVDFGRRHGIVIVNDNPYSFILNEHPLSILSTPGAREVCIEMNSLSKSHNMAGWRIGMAAARPEFIEWILRVKSNIDSGMFRPLQSAAAEALNAPAEWYAELNRVYGERRSAAEKIMHRIGCRFDPKQTGLFVWGRIPETERDSESLSERILHEARVFVTPGFIFGSRGDRYIRISLCATVEMMNEALKRIESVF